MEISKFDISRFLRAPDGKRILTSISQQVNHDGGGGGGNDIISDGSSEPVNRVGLFLIITLIIIAIIVCLHFYNKNNSPTKEALNKSKEK